MEERDPGDVRPVAVMTQDEGRFGRISEARSCWAPKGIRPKIPRQIVRAFVYVYAAVCMAMGKMTSLILPYAYTDMMNLFLEEVSKDFKDYLVIMMVDGAGWHRSGGLKIPENIRLIYQPSHSPELNPVEHLWEELREKHFPNNRHGAGPQRSMKVLCSFGTMATSRYSVTIPEEVAMSPKKQDISTVSVVHRICCGLDVHKQTVVACVLWADQDGRERAEQREFGTMTDELYAMKQWLLGLECPVVAIESTGFYWQAAYNVLESTHQVILVNPRHIKNVPGRKTDLSDSKWLPGLLRYGLVRGSFIPPRNRGNGGR